MKSIAERSLELANLFEAEIFVELLLWRWNHPLANDKEFANGLLEDASSALQDASQGKILIEGVSATDLNFVAAVWYAEQCAVETGGEDPDTLEARKTWLATVRRTLPSCFCDPSDLNQA